MSYLTAYHGTRNLEGIIQTRAIECPLSNVGELRLKMMKNRYDILTKKLADAAKQHSEEVDCFSQIEKYEEALADQVANYGVSAINLDERLRYREEKRELCVYLSKSREVAQAFAIKREYTPAVLWVRFLPEMERRGLSWALKKNVIEIMGKIGIEDVTEVFVSDIRATRELLDNYNLREIKVSFLN